MSALSRRALVTGTAALPALALPAAAIAEPPEPDPVFATIAAHREAFLKRMRVARVNFDLERGDEGKEEAEAVESASRKIEGDATWQLSEVVPTTMAGAIALLRYLEEFQEQRFELLEDPEGWHSDYEEVLFGETYEHSELIDKFSGEPLELPFAYWVMQNVRTALQSFAVAGRIA